MRRSTFSNPIDVNDEMLTISEAALFCKVSTDAMYKRVQRGYVPSHRIGKRIYFVKSELIGHTLHS